MNQRNLAKITFAALASLYFLYYANTANSWHFIDNVNLVIHEAGHWIFSLFGQFMYVAGGSLAQVLLPVIFVIYFFKENQKYSAALCLFWVGQNLINVSVYAGDAVKMQLPLLGGDNSMHDWNWLLIKTGLLHYTSTVAKIIFILGILTIITAGITAIFYSLKQDEKQVNFE